MVSEIQPGQEFKGQCYYGKVKTRSHYDYAYLYPLTNVPTKYQHPTSYSFWKDFKGRGYYSKVKG